MNAVEIEEAVSDLARAPFDPATFPFDFLTAFGVKETTIARLRKGDTNASDVGGVLQRSNIHIAVAAPGDVNGTLRALRESPKTAAAKAKFILASDGDVFEAEDLTSGEALACSYNDFADHFGFFLPLAGISTVKEIKNNPIDVKATGRLNRLYVELLKENADWGTPERRHDLNQFMARLIFCFFAEDTGIFNGTNLFTSTIERMSNNECGSVEFVITELFRAMDTSPEERATAKLRSWADDFPYVNGGLFAGGKPCPIFSKVARSYLLRAGELNWQEINPDIFGSMIQAVAEDSERGSLGMHYTSVPNIMKVLGPLLLDDLQTQLTASGDNIRKLRNLRKRISRIRIFDPACGSGNFLVISYVKLREIENEIVQRTGDEPRSMIALENFFGIEIKGFASEIARLALLIAEFQCDVRFINQQVARSLVLPLKETGKICTGNSLLEDWLEICPPHGGAKSCSDACVDKYDEDEGKTEYTQLQIYICGNPPYKGTKNQTAEQKQDLKEAFDGTDVSTGTLDYVAGWFGKAVQYASVANAKFAFVSTNSVCQGGHVPVLWPYIFRNGFQIDFAYPSFKWSNLASHNAGVTVSVIGVSKLNGGQKKIFDLDIDGKLSVKRCDNINAYLTPGRDIIVKKRARPFGKLGQMVLGNAPYDGGHLIMSKPEMLNLTKHKADLLSFVRPLYGSAEIIDGSPRYCLWIENDRFDEAMDTPEIADRITLVEKMRSSSRDAGTRAMANRPHQFREMYSADTLTIGVPIRSSESRRFIPADVISGPCSISNLAYAIYDAPIWNFSIIVSRLHFLWISTVCGKLETRLSYSNKMGWNTFPVPKLTDTDIDNLKISAEGILLARAECFPDSLAEMYDPNNMPENVVSAHERNDELIERIFIGRRFKNDTERLEKLFELYRSMIAD